MKEEEGILLKISGEYFSSEGKIFDSDRVEEIVQRLKNFVSKVNRPVYIVVGGGNICRGRELESFGFKNGDADRIGILSAVQNALMLKLSFDRIGAKAHVMAPFPARALEIQEYEPGLARLWAKDKGHIVIFGGGLGLCGFTTDTAAVSRAYETGCSMVVKFTEVGGLFTADPKKFPSSTIIRSATFDEVLSRKYKVMDQGAFIFARDNNIKIKIVDLFDERIHELDNIEVGSIVVK